MHNHHRKPLIIRGARQVGKTYAVRSLKSQFKHFLEINFELTPKIASIFEQDLDPKRICRDLALHSGVPIVPGETLLFLDEIQMAPQALLALRYFYEKVPALHVIAAGSLLDIALEQVGIPVGRGNFLYMYPMSFAEFLAAKNCHALLTQLVDSPKEALAEVLHQKLLNLLSEYFAIGGMPEVVFQWINQQSLSECSAIQRSIIESYTQDFSKYAKAHQVKYVSLIFNQIPKMLARHFKYSEVSDHYRKRELAPALELLEKASVIHRVFCSPGHNLPLATESSDKKFKPLFLDIGLAQAQLGLTLKDWILNPKNCLANRGAITEAFVGQEMLAYSDYRWKEQLYYWESNRRSSQAEVDYLWTVENQIIPIEVKSGTTGHLKSMHQFLSSHTQSPFGIKYSANPFSQFEKIQAFPLYGICGLYACNDAIKSLSS